MKNKLELPILITGSSGFIGSSLLRYFVNKEVKTKIILRKKSNTWRINDLIKTKYVEVFECDLNNKIKLNKVINKIKPMTIFHLATYGAYSFQDNENLIKKNILDCSVNLLKSCVNQGFKIFINTGSNSEYGFKTKKMSEKDILFPNSFYAIYKSAVTHYCRFLSISKQIPIITLRPFHVYGPYEEGYRLIPTLVLNLLENKMINLVSPNISRDMIYIDDCIDLYIKVASTNNDFGSVFNVGTGKKTSINKIVELAKKHTNNYLEPKWNTMKHKSWDQKIWLSDMSLVKQKLNWTHKISPESGIKKTIVWMKKNQFLYK